MSKNNHRFPFTHVLSQLLRVILPVVGLMVATRPAGGQDSGIMEGTRVQITVPGAHKITGMVKSRSSDSTTIFVDGNGGVRRFLNSDMTELGVSRGRTAIAGMKKGAMWGGGVGALVALAILATPEDNNQYQSVSNNSLAGQSLLGGLFWGVGIGALTKAEQWDNVSVHPRFGKSSGGVGLSVAFSPSFLH